jgi:hypothetical protein
VKLLFYNSAADVLLLDVPSTIPEAFTAFYLGERGGPHLTLILSSLLSSLAS